MKWHFENDTLTGPVKEQEQKKAEGLTRIDKDHLLIFGNFDSFSFFFFEDGGTGGLEET